MLFHRPLASFKNNIYIDRSDNHKTRRTIFCILKITSLHTSHNNFKTFSLPSKLQKKNKKKGCLKYSNHCFFRPILLFLFFRDSRGRNQSRRIPAVSRIKLKFTKRAQQNAPLLLGINILDHDSVVYNSCKPHKNGTVPIQVTWCDTSRV